MNEQTLKEKQQYENWILTNDKKNEFDIWLEKNKAILNPILANFPKNKNEAEKTPNIDGFIHKAIETLSPLQKHLFIVKKNSKNAFYLEQSKAALLEAKKSGNQENIQQAEKRFLEIEKRYEKELEQAEKIFLQHQENARIYKEKVNASPRQSKLSFAPIKKEQLMKYEDAAKMFWNLYLKDSISPNTFIVDVHNATKVQELIKYFIRDPNCKLNLNKGIFLCGSVGSGKTILMQQLSLFCQDNQFDTAFEFVSMTDYLREIAISGQSAVVDYSTGQYCFDDMAVSYPTIKYFGNELNPLDDLVYSRYKCHTKKNPKLTHCTSNLNFNAKDQESLNLITKYYDLRAIDRLRQMCNFVYLGGESRRK